MSAHFCSSDHFDLIVSIVQELTSGPNYHSRRILLDDPECLAKGGNLDGLRQLLIDENWKSLAHRYPKDYTEHWGDEYLQATNRSFKSTPEVTGWIADSRWGMIIYPVKGYVYQSCEHPTWEESLASKTCLLINAMVLDRVTSAHRGEAAWTDYKHPTDYKGPINLTSLLTA